MAKGLWTVEAGRGLCFNGVRYYTLQREVREKDHSSPTRPTEADAMVHKLVRMLNAGKGRKK